MKLTNNQIRGNLRRAANKGCLSFLDEKIFHCLIIKHFGIIENGKCVGYIDPYTRLEIRDNADLVLEHIIPIISGGGTVAFNCVPSLATINSSKSDMHLIAWWRNSGLYKDDNLVKLMEYMLDAYEISFGIKPVKPLVEEYEMYVDSTAEEIDEDAKDDVYINMERKKRLTTEKTHDYYRFLIDCLHELDEDNIDTSMLKNRISQLIARGVFEDINNYATTQSILKEILIDYLGKDDRKYLTILLNTNIKLLANSIPKELGLEEKKKLIINRLNNVETILKQNEIGMVSFFENISTSQELINNDIININEEKVNQIINGIKISVDDRFNKLVNFVEHNNRLPQQHAENEIEKMLAVFLQQIKGVDLTTKGTKIFNVALSRKQLEYLCNSNSKILNGIYIEILNKSIQKNVNIKYVDETLSLRIKEFYSKLNSIKGNPNISSIEYLAELEEEYSDVINLNDQFYAFIRFVNKHNGKLPTDISPSEEEATLGRTRHSIQIIKKEKNGKVRFAKKLSQEQLKYLHDSKYQSLRNIYKIILAKSIQYDIPIDYIDDELKSRILEFNKKMEEAKMLDGNISIERQIEIMKEYADIGYNQDKFLQTMMFVLDNGDIPKRRGKTQEEIELGNYLGGTKAIHKLKSGKIIFNCKLSEQQLKYLCNSDNEVLRKHYIEILSKAILNNIQIDYVDKTLEERIRDYYLERKKLVDNNCFTIENQIMLEEKYADIIIEKDNFLGLVSFVIKHGKFPVHWERSTEEQKLRNYKDSLITIDSKRKGKLSTTLNSQQIDYLLNSDIEILRSLGELIVERMGLAQEQSERRGMKK